MHTRIQGYEDTMRKGYTIRKDTTIQGYKDTRIQGYKDKCLQGYKDTNKDTRIKGYNDTTI